MTLVAPCPHKPGWLPATMAALLLAVALSASAARPAALKPFTATYQASYMGLRGTGTMTLVAVGGDRWKYSLEIDGAVARLSQNTVFQADGGHWKPLSNSDSSLLLIKKSSKHATYDWDRREARWSGNVKPDRAGPVALRAGDLDAMLVNLAIVRDVQAGEASHSYRMVDDGRAKQMTFRVVGKDTIDVDGKSHAATRVSMPDGSRETVLWIAEGVPVPMRILRRHNGDDEMDLRLRSLH
ncbi:DUF3108 domain-containing protein [Cognatiluteimonas weifangensis]|nr:DUF3108 domain-containing protein [Luteimonas weifangensis]